MTRGDLIANPKSLLRLEGVNRLRGVKERPPEKKLVVEGSGDLVLIEACGPSGMRPRMRPTSIAGKSRVYYEVVRCMVDNSIEAWGLVDMDGIEEDDRHLKWIRSATKHHGLRKGLDALDTSPEHIVANLVKDTRSDVCLMAALDGMIEGAWIPLFEEGLRKQGYDVKDWGLVFDVARFRSWIHGFDQMKNVIKKEVWMDAKYAQVRTRWEYMPEGVHPRETKQDNENAWTFSEWASQISEQSTTWGKWNDHCLAASIVDHIYEGYNGRAPSMTKVERMMRDSFIDAIVEYRLDLDTALEHFGFFGPDTDDDE